ncbi:hypothetical protein [Mangrovicoccus sp. HB161399]|uniref:hypothetical protein n=1 Tax=Mangrovicoccus sp. HB161399 TaxID=2720392 RepID=UPI001552CB1F|nr:hypothetical protein [Mangrovicoccus sp. HB161399]
MIAKYFPSFATLAAVAVTGCAALAQPASDPDWPCVQRKVSQLSPGLMWAHPIPEMKLDAETAAAADDVVARLVLRRMPLEEVQPALDGFADAHGGGEAMMSHLFGESFDKLSHLRTRIMKGIEEYAQKQIALSKRIDGARSEMDTLMAADDPDYDRVDELEVQIDWDERIFTDRQRSLTYVCETPVLLEKRLYGIAQMLEAEIRS